jgi:methionyl-tRNA formyltransferase
MQMEAGLDCGPVIAKKISPITPNTNYGDLHNRLAANSAELLMKNIDAIANGSTRAVPQPVTGISYADKITLKDTIIDWTMPAERLERQIRAFSPTPGAITQFNNKRLKILAAQAKLQQTKAVLSPGSIAFLDNKHCEIACGQGLLSLSEVQLEGRRTMPIAEFLRGAKLESGTQMS